MCAGQVSGSLFDLLGDGGESSSASSLLPAPLTAAPFAAPRDSPAICLGVSSEAIGLGDDDAGRDGKMCAGQVSISFFDLLGDDGKSSFASSPLTAAPSAALRDSPADVLGVPSIGRVLGDDDSGESELKSAEQVSVSLMARTQPTRGNELRWP